MQTIMPPKRKDLLKPKQKGKAKVQEPQTENDFLDAADEFEQAAGKWRAGDAVKAARFFNRAIEAYNEGLKRYPQSFDLAYNKANLQFVITEDERIVSHLGYFRNKTALLQETLNSHRFASSLKPTNTDILFNTAQALTSLAEAGLEASTQTAAKQDAIPLLEEAVEIFTTCLESQQQQYSQIQEEIARAEASGEYREGWEGEQQQPVETQEEKMETDSETSEAPGDWATVEEPLTPESILDTCTVQLTALTTLLGLYDPRTSLSDIEKRAHVGMNTAMEIIPALIELSDKSPSKSEVDEPKGGPTLSIGSLSPVEDASTTPREDAILAAANFEASIAEVQYRSGRTTSTEYAQAVEQTFGILVEEAKTSETPNLGTANILSAYGDALMDVASALVNGKQHAISSPTFATDIDIQWTALTQTQTLFTQLSSAPYTFILPPSRLANIFIARGDIDLFRFRISLFEGAKLAWLKSGPTLVANAGVFYRGARSYADRAGAAQVRATADAKAIVAEILKEVASGSAVIKDSWKGRSVDVAKVLEQMVEEDVVDGENVEGVLKMTQ
ncbi:tetratricopeptide-like helical [Pyrenophora seminiperda CCB06]|uniref:Tetratricopeptide-like helical n=1 Tax=Pyrenophora seminiperda CCB06 TaxID=1302712 RepID=A0A3M7MD22_9PLEO|nr:tetratricopeptide-like helical [Pyrenophora seminiperda CCB06]